MPSKVVTITQKDLAAVFGVSRESIRLWEKSGMPKRGTGYVVSDCVQWRRDRDKEDAASNAKPDLAIEQARKMRADADLSELKVSQMRGSLIAAADVEHEMERLCGVLRARVLSVRGRWAPKVLGLSTMAEATATLDALANDVLDALRAGADDLEEPEGEDATDEEAA